MIISASRRTDIPAFYSEWLMQRLRAGVVLVRNPMNAHQISKVSLHQDVVDCIVFWTKDPTGLLPHLTEIEERGYPFYFQFTLNPYGPTIEKSVPSLEERIEVFQGLSRRIGKHRVVWRYDPILFSPTFSHAYHCERFAELAAKLSPYTECCVISYLDEYAKTRRNMRGLSHQPVRQRDIQDTLPTYAAIASQEKLQLETCCEAAKDVVSVRPSRCIDPERIARIVGAELSVAKDKNQRADCGCCTSIDIGAYNTCGHQCAYCYANFNWEAVCRHQSEHDPDAPLLVGQVGEQAEVRERECHSLVNRQGSLFDL